MTTYYVETSSFLAWLFGESGATNLNLLFKTKSNIVTSSLLLLEAHRGVRRIEQEESITRAQAEKLRGVIADVTASWFVMQITPDVEDRAKSSFPKEPVRSLDAIHLATVLLFLQAFPDLQVVSQDARIVDNLKPLGLELWKPK